MVYKSFKQLIDTNISKASVKTVAVVCAEDDHSVGAAMEAGREGIIRPLLIAGEEKIKPLLETYGDYCDYELLPVSNQEEAVQTMVEVVNNGKADAIMKGLIQTADFMKAVVSKENNLRTGQLISHMVVIELPTYHKLLCVTDPAMMTYPDVDQKKQIILNAVDMLTRIGFGTPKVAALAAVDFVNPKMPESVDAGLLKEMYERGEIPGCILEGPISYDLAVHKESAGIKGYDSPVAGDADILLAPNITVGNVLIKSLAFSAQGIPASIVTGAKVPIVLTSRASSQMEKFNSLVLAASLKGDH